MITGYLWIYLLFHGPSPVSASPPSYIALPAITCVLLPLIIGYIHRMSARQILVTAGLFLTVTAAFVIIIINPLVLHSYRTRDYETADVLSIFYASPMNAADYGMCQEYRDIKARTSRYTEGNHPICDEPVIQATLSLLVALGFSAISMYTAGFIRLRMEHRSIPSESKHFGAPAR